jgi:excisionase family DNA binding protein
MGETAAEIERRLERGEWLRPGDVATLLSVHRMTIDRMIRAGRIRFRLVPGTGKHRECNPEDVRRELVARRVVREGYPEIETGPAPEEEQGQQDGK